ncbi:MAG: TetR/AcrR family transcriptional regulator [Cetobacterium sp.]|uniref:TetR/AcrR family transcriptional regulator n=1 Tax=Cetobacterium sp. TaxID=2071632 RepID=UPI003EE4E529
MTLDTRSIILNAATDLAISKGLYKMRRDDIGNYGGISYGSIHHHFGTMANLRREVMMKAVKCELLSIIAQGLAQDDEIAQNAPSELKRRAVETML